MTACPWMPNTFWPGWTFLDRGPDQDDHHLDGHGLLAQQKTSSGVIIWFQLMIMEILKQPGVPGVEIIPF